MCFRRGRPCNLNQKEEEYVVLAVKYLRQKGSPVDKEVLTELGRKAISMLREVPLEKVPELTEHWAKSFRKRKQLTK